MIKWAILCAYLATLASAATKRDEFGGAANSPIYGSSAPSSVQSGAPSSSNYNYNSYPSSYGSSPSAASGVAGVSGPYQAVDQSQGAASNVGVGSYGSGQGSSANNQGNLYYYYYPVGDKAKGQDAQGYQMASSNQYPSLSAANPMASESNQHASVDSSSSSQDLSYSQDFNQNVGQGNSYYGSAYDPNAAAYGAASSNGAPSYAPPSDGSSFQGPLPSFGNGQAPYGGQPPMFGGAAYQQFGNGGQIPNFGNFGSASEAQGTFAPVQSSSYRRYGLGSIIMPMLALAGLSLLIPTVTSLGTAAGATGRRRRSTNADPPKEGAIGGYLDRLERFYSIYRTAVEREECMNRIICELGDAVSGVRGKTAFVTVLEKMVPNWMNNKVGVFKNAALSQEFGKCKKYSC